LPCGFIIFENRGMIIVQRARHLAGRMARTIPWLRRQLAVSTDYLLISEAEARRVRSGGWLSSMTARRQERAYTKLLEEMKAGSPRVDLTVAAQAIDALNLHSLSLLEIGCGSGYYCEVFATLAKSMVRYTGIDYSPAMIKRAKYRYPDGNFVLGDATRMSAFEDGSFDVAFNGVSLMHVLDYERAIAESARVAKRACIFHSVPVFPSHPTVHIHKYAYGSPVVEIVFSRADLLECFARNGLSLARSWRSIPYDVTAIASAPSHSETFLCLRRIAT
jgi:ubiquinone/menaquinone biosynthesis C-methylase UbiE